MSNQTLELAFSRALARKALVRPDLMAECWSYLAVSASVEAVHASSAAHAATGSCDPGMGADPLASP